MNCRWIARILVHHPFIILLAIGIFSGTCLIIPFLLKNLPDFSDPQLGFETRGTVFANRIMAWRNLVEATRPNGQFAVNPKQFIEWKNKYRHSEIKKNRTRKIQPIPPKPEIVINEGKRNDTNSPERTKWLTLKDFVKNHTAIAKVAVIKDGYFCGPPDVAYAHVVLESTKNADLFTLDSLFLLCGMEYELTHAKYYRDLCMRTNKKPKQCCRPWSLANYIALLHKRTSCLAITEDDVAKTKKLLQSCAQYYHNLQLAPDCYESNHCKVPVACTLENAVFNILNYLTSTSFLHPNSSSNMVLKQTMIFLPVAGTIRTLPYYHVLEKTTLKFKDVSIVGIEFGLKAALFDEYLFHDTWLMVFGGLFVFMCIWIYTESLFLTVMTIVAIAFSLGISYFMYTLIFELKFFPFMNILAAVVVIGIGADDAFIFCKVWHSLKQQPSRSTLSIMYDTFQHAFISMLITSLTTAAAFLASYVSSITTVCCFSIFAATAVVANCILMMLWLPACMVVREDWCNKCDTYKQRCMSVVWAKLRHMERALEFELPVRFTLWENREKILIDSVIKYRYYWVILLSGLTLISGPVVFYYPKLQPPNSMDLQLFDSSHPFERYDTVYKNMFWFQRSERFNADNYMNYKLPLRFVWGILPVDNGNYLDPHSHGTLQLDPKFDISAKESQLWLFQFCRRIRKQPFYQRTLGPLLPNCFIESFVSWMQRRCVDPVYDIDRTPCCESEVFPYNNSVFNYCILSAMADLYDTPAKYFIPGMAGPKFSKDQFPTIKAIVVEYDSNYTYSMSYTYMDDFFQKVEHWTNEQLKTAPVAMKGGWFVSEYEFYDLQQVLCRGTMQAISVSMALALIVLMISTLNVLASFYATLTITCSILVIMAVLVLFGWKLNVLESIAVSTAIGLAIDFSLHYTVHYRLCPHYCDREISTRYALTNMAGPASMAAITTGAAGAFMTFSSVLPYIQIGIFLVTVMSISWFYATFFLGSLLAIAGPQNRFGQFYYSNILCCSRKTPQPTTRRPASSSVSETIELDSLTSKSGFIHIANANRFSTDGINNPRRSHNDQTSSDINAITVMTDD